MAQRARKTTSRPALSAEIVDRALELAEDRGWGEVTLRQVAADLGVPLAQIYQHYRDLDAVADAWFARALQEMLRPPEPGFPDLPARERLYLVLLRWFEANGPRRRVVGEMIRAKLHPPHPHHWVPMIFSLSRLIQWLREVALLEAGGRRRQVEEVGLTLLFLATLRVWLADSSENQEVTRRFLRRRLERADRWMARCWPPGRAGLDNDEGGWEASA
jgi:AcrR family transcriptional regulator